MTSDLLLPQKEIITLGPEGSFSSQAARILNTNAKISFSKTIPEIFNTTRESKNLYGVAPLENSQGGKVGAAYGSLSELVSALIYAPDDQNAQPPLYMMNQLFMLVAQSVMAKDDIPFNKIKTVVSHQQGLLQCSDMIKTYKWKTLEVDSTSLAAQMVAESKDHSMAAIGSITSAHINKLHVTCADAANVTFDRFTGKQKRNVTRWGQFSAEEDYLPEDYMIDSIQASFTTLVGGRLEQNSPGYLAKIVNLFTKYGIDIMDIHSIGSFGMTGGFMELRGHAKSDALQTVIEESKVIGTPLTVFGCYPTLDPQKPAIPTV